MKNKNIFAVYKPSGPSSNRLLNQIRRQLNTKKVGHAGTLDPLARGILVVAVGRKGTRELAHFVAKEKEYKAVIRLGYRSTTYDQEGELELVSDQRPARRAVKEAVNSFVGIIQQQPPIFSALKIKGQPAYKLARQGKKVELRARSVDIKKIRIISYRYPFLKIKVVCGPGTYIRSLAFDIGEKLGVGAYLFDLERTRVGQFSKRNAKNIKRLKFPRE